MIFVLIILLFSCLGCLYCFNRWNIPKSRNDKYGGNVEFKIKRNTVGGSTPARSGHMTCSKPARSGSVLEQIGIFEEKRDYLTKKPKKRVLSSKNKNRQHLSWRTMPAGMAPSYPPQKHSLPIRLAIRLAAWPGVQAMAPPQVEWEDLNEAPFDIAFFHFWRTSFFGSSEKPGNCGRKRSLRQVVRAGTFFSTLKSFRKSIL